MGTPARREGALEQVRVGGARSRGAGRSQMGNPARREGALEQVRVGGARSRGAGGARWGTQPGGRGLWSR